jgi:hypothetical protein
MQGLTRLLKVSYNTIQKRILCIADKLKPNIQIEPQSIFETDELRT